MMMVVVVVTGIMYCMHLPFHLQDMCTSVLSLNAPMAKGCQPSVGHVHQRLVTQCPHGPGGQPSAGPLSEF